MLLFSSAYQKTSQSLNDIVIFKFLNPLILANIQKLNELRVGIILVLLQILYIVLKA